MADFEKSIETIKKIAEGDYSPSTQQLEQALHLVGAGSLEANEKIASNLRFEIQKRQTYATIIEMEKSNKQMAKSVEWSKWMTIATTLMAFATVILAIITYFKP